MPTLPRSFRRTLTSAQELSLRNSSSKSLSTVRPLATVTSEMLPTRECACPPPEEQSLISLVCRWEKVKKLEF